MQFKNTGELLLQDTNTIRDKPYQFFIQSGIDRTGLITSNQWINWIGYK